METQQQPSIAFSGSIPKYYDSYLGPMFFEPYAHYMAKIVNSIAPVKILELASGTGRLTKLLPATLAENGEIIATDINPAMVDYGHKVVEHESIKWMKVDALELPFDDNSYDCVVVQFGVMFYSDRAKAFSEAKRVLKPGGTFVFCSWDEIKNNPMPTITNETLQHFFPVETPAFYSVPFSYFNPQLITADLEKAGFKQINIESVKLHGVSSSAKEAAKGLILGTPTVTAIEERDAEKLPLVIDYLANKITEKFGNDTLEIPLQAQVVTCVKL